MDDQSKKFLIRDLDQLIDKHLPCDQSRIVSTEYSNFIALDDYGCMGMTLEFVLINTTTGEEWTLHTIAKKISEKNDVKDMFNVKTTFKKEIGLYMIARDALNKFLKSKGEDAIECISTPFGGRFNLNGFCNSVDEDAVLILSNLKKYGFRRLDQRIGLDLECAKIVLKALAHLHGSALGMKLLEPEAFEQKVMPYLSDCYSSRSFHKITRDQMIEVLKEENFSSDIIKRATMTFDRRSIKNIREPWATITHNNIWVNNIRVRYNNRHEPISIKLIDFRISEYQSPARDLLFFLFTSVELETLRNNLDDLIDFYYHNVIYLLHKLQLDTRYFTRWSFNEELRIAGRQSEFFKIVSRLYAVLDNEPELTHGSQGKIVDAIHRDRLCYIVREFDKRNWLSI